MYIIYPIEKDTYITNKLLKNVDGRNANFGKSSTLDLFKTYNENPDLKSRCVIKVNGTNLQTFVDARINFTDTNGDQKTLLIDNNLESNDPSNGTINVANEYVFCTKDLSTDLELLTNAIQDIFDASFAAQATFKIITHAKSGLIIIEQNNAGEAGDNSIAGSFNIDHGVNDIVFEIKQEFSRVEESVLLLKANLTANNDFFSYEKVGIDKLKIYLELHDITTSLSKPRDYTVEALPLAKDFNEGLGRDVYSLSDIDTANWLYCDYNGNTNEKISWESNGNMRLIEGEDSNFCDIITKYDNYDFKDLCNAYIKEGNENIVIDVTPIYEKYWEQNSTLYDKGFAVKFADLTFFDDETYFAKRLGSKNIRNKHLSPCLKILIDDDSYNIPINKYFYFNETNKVFLYNKKGGTLRNIQKILNGNIVDIDPSIDLKLSISSIATDNNNVPLFTTQNQIGCFQMKDIKNNQLNGIYYADWSITTFDNLNVLNYLLENSSMEFNFSWFDGAGQLIYSDIQRVYKDTLTTINTFKRLRASVKLYSPDLGIMNDLHKISVTFFDIDAQYDYVKVKKTLEGLDVGEVFYEVIDYDTNEVLIPTTYEKNATKCLKEKDYYWFPFFNSDIFYGRRLQFIFKLTQQEQNNLIVNANEVFRVGNNG